MAGPGAELRALIVMDRLDRTREERASLGIPNIAHRLALGLAAFKSIELEFRFRNHRSVYGYVHRYTPTTPRDQKAAALVAFRQLDIPRALYTL